MDSMRYTRYRLDPRLAGILGPLGDTPTGRDLRERLTQLVEAAPVIADDVSPVWNELWTKVGNVGSRPAETSGPRLFDRTLSDVALSLVRDALVTQVPLYAEDA